MTKFNENRVDVVLAITIGAGNLIFEGTVANISAHGFKVIGLPLRFDPQEKNIQTIIATHQGNFRLKVQVRWLIVTNQTLEVGFEIINHGDNWLQFIEGLEPQIPPLPGKLLPPAAFTINPSVYSGV